jgi:L-lysine exporter family protein LysE/ArgO
MGTFLLGYGTGLSLIVAIGAQNAFVLRQGIRGNAVVAVVTICALSDIVLIALGVGGIGSLVERFPQAVKTISIVGGAFLIAYALMAARRAMNPQPLVPATGGTLLTCLALTWLNPHVYLDTVLLLGSIAAGSWVFGAGAMVASLTWFSALGFGARLLSGFFARPASWRVLDGVVAATMATLGLTLLTA